MNKNFRASFEKVAFINPKSLLNTIPKASQKLGIIDKPGKIVGSLSNPSKSVGVAKNTATSAAAKPAPSAPLKPAPKPAVPMESVKHRGNSHAEYMRQIGAVGKTSKNDGNVLRYSSNASGGNVARKSQFESITPVVKTPVGPDRGTLK